MGDEAAPDHLAALLVQVPLFALSLGPFPRIQRVSASLGKKSLDPGLALLPGFNRLRWLEVRLWEGKVGGNERESSKAAA